MSYLNQVIYSFDFNFDVSIELLEFNTSQSPRIYWMLVVGFSQFSIVLLFIGINSWLPPKVAVSFQVNPKTSGLSAGQALFFFLVLLAMLGSILYVLVTVQNP
jgi:hypothetical protein